MGYFQACFSHAAAGGVGEFWRGTRCVSVCSIPPHNSAVLNQPELRPLPPFTEEQCGYTASGIS